MTVTVPDPTPGQKAFTDDPVARGERAALLACDEPRYRDYLAKVLRGGGLRVHQVDTHAAAIARLSAGRPRYVAVVLIENLESAAGNGENIFLQHLAALPGVERRDRFVALVGQSIPTGDSDAAFAASVDVCLSYQDVGRFAEVVLPAMEERQEAITAWNDAATAT